MLSYIVLLSLSCPTLYDPMNCSMPGFPVLHYLPEFVKLVFIESVMPSNCFILCCPLLLLPSVFPSIKIFSMSWLFASGGQSIGASASASVLPMNSQDWFPLGLTSLISLLSKGLSRVFSSTSIISLAPSLLYGLYVQGYWKNHSFDYTSLCQQSDTMLSRCVMAFLPRSRRLLISCLQSPSAVILEPRKVKSVTIATSPPSICHEVMGLELWSLFFECWVLSQLSHCPLPAHQEVL